MPGKFQPERNLFQKKDEKLEQGAGGHGQGEDAPFNPFSPRTL